MRIRLNIHPKRSSMILPCHYNHMLQGFIYDHLDPRMADIIHNKGFVDGQSRRTLRFFTFSRLLPRASMIVKNGYINFKGPVSLVVCSPNEAFIESFVMGVLTRQEFFLGQNPVLLDRVEVLKSPPYAEVCYIRTLSPIVSYSTFDRVQGGRRVVYYSPKDDDFERTVLANLRRKVRTWLGKDVDGGSIRPFLVDHRNKHVVKYKDTVIEGWSGVYELRLPEEMFCMAFDAGLGAKNSQGFGCIELWNRRRPS
ncbi:CRISPR-associated endoribonuclease Cas6 [Thermodesulforhabdus norvegica]|uniref:CRISPR-associated endoribonuclease n=1 Tax=Thermodesulforhabdus norvegica TaxID=39841 RepID=A0A1I4QHU6_9BACT|nr:CRISPR-associated endoribonuclease Cas6 [Thermodesulforhabdus norvegica]SFM39594.1 CRISPR-associated endoribonuclease Cas6 [Thermodesulforhabdus norvegica]